jgi:hypothetical protein
VFVHGCFAISGGSMMKALRSSVLCVALVAAVMAGAADRAAAQSSQGGLRGVVKDSQGVIPGVTVALVN